MFQNPKGFSASGPAPQDVQSIRAAAATIFPRLGLDIDWTFVGRQWRWIVVGLAAALLLLLVAELTLTPVTARPAKS